MNTKKYHLDNYRKFLLNRVTASPHIIEYIENCLASEDDAAPHSFHKVMVHNWSGGQIQLFETLSEYFACSFIPVQFTSLGEITTFYTSSLTLIMKIEKLDFMFPYQRNMFNVDILFNDKTSADCFENRVTIENVVSGVVSCRFNEKFELDLSNFSNDPEFIQKKIHFYKLGLLSNFKILMLRMGRDTKALNLSSNKLSQVPVEILNFFMKGDLKAINLSDNEIPSMSELQRISSKIEKLWIEGNPLCEDIDAMSYIKQITIKFPRIMELDGLRLNEHGIALPFFKNYLETPENRTKMLVEKFLSLYFAHYDTMPRATIEEFYDMNATLTISTIDPPVSGENPMKHYTDRSRNALSKEGKPAMTKKKKRLYSSRAAVAGILREFPECMHDPTSFTVDVLKHDKNFMIIVLDGIFKEISYYEIGTPQRYYQFRRTFVFNIVTKNKQMSEYYIMREMFSIIPATEEQIENSFKNPARNTNPLSLKDPEPEDMEAFYSVFTHITQLKRPEVELRLKMNNWDMRKALREFFKEVKSNKIASDRFMEEDDFSDTSSLVEDEID